MKTKRALPALRAMLTIFMGASNASPRMEAVPAKMRQVAPGQFQTLPGSRFEPNRNVIRAKFHNSASRLINLMFGE